MSRPFLYFKPLENFTEPELIEYNEQCGKAALYQVLHMPTRATYIGWAIDAHVAYMSWRHRLTHLETAPPLSFAFRAVYTQRIDFAFAVLKFIDMDDPNYTKEVKYLKQMYMDTILTHGKQYLLNCNRSRSELIFWINWLREHDRQHGTDGMWRLQKYKEDNIARARTRRAGRLAEKVKLIPGKVQEREKILKNIHHPEHESVLREFGSAARGQVSGKIERVSFKDMIVPDAPAPVPAHEDLPEEVKHEQEV